MYEDPHINQVSFTPYRHPKNIKDVIFIM